METKSLKVEISARATSQGLSLGFLNSVLISQSWEIEELLVDENNDGNITSLGSYLDPSFSDKLSLLRVQDFAPTTVHQHIHRRFNDPLLSRLITDQIVVESRRRDLPQGPVLMTVFLKFTKKDYIVLPCNSASPTTRTVEESCAICLEDMSEESEQALCQPPGCVHMFHEDCFVKWLKQHDSCPLCRQSTNPLTNNKPSRILEELTEA